VLPGSTERVVQLIAVGCGYAFKDPLASWFAPALRAAKVGSVIAAIIAEEVLGVAPL
jgi:hypothetical protein